MKTTTAGAGKDLQEGLDNALVVLSKADDGGPYCQHNNQTLTELGCYLALHTTISDNLENILYDICRAICSCRIDLCYDLGPSGGKENNVRSLMNICVTLLFKPSFREDEAKWYASVQALQPLLSSAPSSSMDEELFSHERAKYAESLQAFLANGIKLMSDHLLLLRPHKVPLFSELQRWQALNENTSDNVNDLDDVGKKLSSLFQSFIENGTQSTAPISFLSVCDLEEAILSLIGSVQSQMLSYWDAEYLSTRAKIQGTVFHTATHSTEPNQYPTAVLTALDARSAACNNPNVSLDRIRRWCNKRLEQGHNKTTKAMSPITNGKRKVERMI